MRLISLLIVFCCTLFAGCSAEQKYGPEVQIAKASTSFRMGTVVTKEHITFAAVPIRFLPPEPVLEQDLKNYIGRRSTRDISEGEMLLSRDFATSGTNKQLDIAVRLANGEALTPNEILSGLGVSANEVMEVYRKKNLKKQ